MKVFKNALTSVADKERSPITHQPTGTIILHVTTMIHIAGHCKMITWGDYAQKNDKNVIVRKKETMTGKKLLDTF
jgi:hypothetical protein